MKAITIKQKLTLILLSSLLISFHPVMANSDMKMMGDVQKARAMSRQNKYQYKHLQPVDKSQEFRGVYYGYLPCSDCAGIKMTLSLKNRKNYLLVTQYAQRSNKEFFEKGKYNWDDKSDTLTLISRKDSSVRKFRIKDEGTLIQVFQPIRGSESDYSLLRTDKKKTRELHIH